MKCFINFLIIFSFFFYSSRYSLAGGETFFEDDDSFQKGVICFPKFAIDRETLLWGSLTTLSIGAVLFYYYWTQQADPDPLTNATHPSQVPPSLQKETRQTLSASTPPVSPMASIVAEKNLAEVPFLYNTPNLKKQQSFCLTDIPIDNTQLDSPFDSSTADHSIASTPAPQDVPQPPTLSRNKRPPTIFQLLQQRLKDAEMDTGDDLP